MKTSLWIIVIAFLLHTAYARWRWEDVPILGLFCFRIIEPNFCIRNRTQYFAETYCGDNPENPDWQLWNLANFYYESGNTDEDGGLFNRGWLNDCQYCSWEGITCDESGIITEIDISGAGVEGELPSVIASFTSLQSLKLHSNEFEGDIPSELGLLSSLTTLELHYNSFEGDMPEEVCLLGGTNGHNITISADCGKPRAEVKCDINTCCDLCYIDSLRPSN